MAARVSYTPIVAVAFSLSIVGAVGAAHAQAREGARGLDSPRAPSDRRRSAPTPPVATPPPVTSPPATSPTGPHPSPPTPPASILPLAPDAAPPQSIVALDRAPRSGVSDSHHFEDGDSDELPWPEPYRAAMPLGGPHFVVELSAGFLAPQIEAQPYAQLVLGIEGFTGVLRLRAMIGFAAEGVVQAPPMMWSSTRARQGGLNPMLRFSMGGDAAPWLAIRVAAGAGVEIWSDIYPTFDAAFEIAVRLTDERRLELGISGGPSMRYVLRPDTGPFSGGDRARIEFAARIAFFIGGVL